MAIEFLLQARGDLLNVAGGDRAGPSEPATSQFSMNGCEARRDAAGIRLNVEAVPDAPDGAQETVRDQAKSQDPHAPNMHPLGNKCPPEAKRRSQSGIRARSEA